MLSRKFLFDYNRFHLEAKPFIEEADRSNYVPILQYAGELTAEHSTTDWILENSGASLFQLNTLSRDPAAQIGFAFLVLLSKFLSPPPVDYIPMGGVGAILALADLHEREEISTIMKGLPTSFLFKPGQHQGSSGDPRWRDPAYYWWWVRPTHAYFTKWIDMEMAAHLHQKLDTLLIRFLGMTDTERANLPRPLPKTNIESECKNYLSILRSALDSRMGLFEVTA
jgi:hypothetical protein